jgi:hypothetical protein
MLRKPKGNFGNAHDFVNFSPAPVILDGIGDVVDSVDL